MDEPGSDHGGSASEDRKRNIIAHAGRTDANATFEEFGNRRRDGTGETGDENSKADLSGEDHLVMLVVHQP